MAYTKSLPLFAFGKVIKGFGRGSKELGIPTANLSEATVELLPENLSPGIYYGFASVDSGAVHKMVLSLGWNPFYNNKKKSMETHILHTFDKDFYGSVLKIIVLGYIRPEQNYSSQDELIKAIKCDIAFAQGKIEEPNYKQFFHHPFWTKPCGDHCGVEIKETIISNHADTSSLEPRTNGAVVLNGEA